MKIKSVDYSSCKNSLLVWTSLFIVLMFIFMSMTYSSTYYTKLPVEVISESPSVINSIDLKESARKAAYSLDTSENLTQADQAKLIKMLGGNKLDQQNNQYLFSKEFNGNQSYEVKEATYKQAFEYRILQKDAIIWTWIFLIMAGIYIYIVSYMLANIGHTKGVRDSRRFK